MVSVEEMHAIEAEFMTVFNRYRDRLADKTLRPDNALPVELLFFAFPMRLPEVSQ
jgi:hypothetical protein